MYDFYYYDKVLYHHGVAGQKWGKRNGPPYPLGKSQVSSAERKAGWVMSKFASGAKTVGKATGRGIKKTAKAVDTAAVRANLKPRIFMSDDQIRESIERQKLEIEKVKTNKNYQRALRGKFNDISDVQKQRLTEDGKTILSRTKDIFKQKIIPTTIAGTTTYLVARFVAKRSGENPPSALGMIFGNTGYLPNNNKGGNKNKNNKGGNKKLIKL